MLATALLRLGKLTGRAELLAAAQGILQAAFPILQAAPEAVAQSLVAADLWLGATAQVVLCGPHGDPAVEHALRVLRQSYLPRSVIACRTSDAAAPYAAALDPLFAGKTDNLTEVTLYVCENFACQAPVRGMDKILTTAESLASHGLPPPAPFGARDADK
jgi:hypothetical protein